MISVVAYDTAWPAQFEAEAARLVQALGELALRIEHVGSTSVPGLAAKAVIDIQISVASLDDRDAFAAALGGLDYVHVPLGDFDAVYPFFQKPADWPCTHHVHLCVAGSDEERRHLAFRDRLRRDPVLAAHYAELKRRLASTHDGDSLASRERYSLSKSDFIAAALDTAAAEADNSPPNC